ncbi:hypothetical protein [Massilia timonae]|uniref:hypothetical protein n=1 Tax=Massilia timonae TaxID=47229 RepID=UPI0028D5AB06|nr:hypothetical protein [Massilia timonae]
MTQPSELPLWVEYIKALGTPAVALIAACVAGFIAYRQWITARNKLKLDFFDRRMEIYRLAISVLERIRDDDEGAVEAMHKLDQALPAARWLFNTPVSLYLHELELRAWTSYKRYADFKVENGELTAQFLEREKTSKHADYQSEIQRLDQVIGPFLSLAH